MRRPTSTLRAGAGASARRRRYRSGGLCLHVWLLLLPALSIASDGYESLWAQAKAELDAERWRSALPLYEKTLQAFSANTRPREDLREETRHLVHIRSEYGLVLLRVAWAQQADAERSAALLASSKQQLDDALAQAHELGSGDLLGHVHDNLAGWHYVQGSDSDVIENLRIAQGHHAEAGDHGAAARVLNNLGLVYRKLGELRSAQRAFHQGLASAEFGASLADKGHLHLNSSVLYRALGDLAQAKYHAKRGLDLFQQAGMPRSVMASRSAIAIVERELGHPDIALAQRRLALDFFLDEELNYDEAVTRQEMIVDLMEAGNIAEAFTESVALLEDESKFGRQASRLTLYANHARLLVGRGKPHEAVEFANGRLQQLDRDLRDRFGQIELLSALHAGYVALDDVRQASLTADRMFGLIEDQRTQFESARLGPMWSAKTYSHYAEHVEFLLDSDDDGASEALARRAFLITERARSASLRQRRHEMMLIRHNVDSRARRQWREVVKNLLKGQDHQADVSAKLETERRFNAARESYFATHGGLTNLSSSLAPIGIDQLQHQLTDRQVVLMYFDGPEFVWRYQIGRTGWRVDSIGEREALISLTSSAYDEVTGVEPSAGGSTAALSSRLLGDIVVADTVDQILYVPTVGLSQVPLAALTIAGKNVVDVAATVTVPSLSEYFQSQGGRPSEGMELAVFADPHFADDFHGYRADVHSEGLRNWSSSLPRLPYSAREASLLKRLYEADDSVVFTGMDANRTNLFSDRVLGSRVLHIATHGYFDEATPELIGIALSKDGDSDDGFVSMAEIAAQDIGSELVVISACDTSRGQRLAGEGTLSLARTFLSQGASSVVSTLWPVSDRATAVFMNAFYTGLKSDGLSVPDALRVAQLSLRENPRYSEPFYWGAYVLNAARPTAKL